MNTPPKARTGFTLPRFFGPLAGIVLFQSPFPIKGCEATGDRDDKYMTRYRLMERPDAPGRPGFGLYLHVFHRSDRDVFHNHPWAFTSLILWNGYIEEVPTVYPAWETEPGNAAAFAAAVFRTPRFVRVQTHTRAGERRHKLRVKYDRQAAQRAGKFCGNWVPGMAYPAGSIVQYLYPTDTLYRPSVTGREYFQKVNDDAGIFDNNRPPYQQTTEWERIDPDAPRLLDVRPLTVNKRPACFVHRVKLRRDAQGREKPAVTLVWRGPKPTGVWGFFLRGGRFQNSEEFSKENGC